MAESIVADVGRGKLRAGDPDALFEPPADLDVVKRFAKTVVSRVGTWPPAP
jgi:hypothetical protein